MKRILLVLNIMLLALSASAAVYSVDEIPNVHIADSTRYVSDPDNILSPAARAGVDSIMADIRRSTTAEAVVVIVGDIDGGDIDDFATSLFTEWGLGKSDVDNGLLVLVAKDLRRAAIRPGYGLEGVLPDIVCAGILRNQMFPAFKTGDYDRGVIDAADALRNILKDPEAAEEIKSAMGAAGNNDDDLSLKTFFKSYFTFAAVIALLMFIVFALVVWNKRRHSRHDKYMALSHLKPIYLALTFFGLGIPAIVTIPMLLLMNRYRNSPRICPNCGTKMTKVDEENDNDYLSHAQDTEERIGSVDYDVWLCPKCGETDIEPYVNNYSGFTKCDKCGAFACRLTRDRILYQPTTVRKGQGVKEYTCYNCGHINPVYYVIPTIAPMIIPGGGRGGGGGFGGGFGGGSFGGGATGGGGASGGW
ncbi:MAG: TPM domain-containing protein [Muribaculaceae bacterium]|nr:TPM domain-containing protein [Muribaculaceae bacterium]